MEENRIFDPNIVFMKKYSFAGSILSADLLNLERDVTAAIEAGIDIIHFDVMDFHFVPNLTFGPAFLKALRKKFPDTIFDVHLMVDDLTEAMVYEFIQAGASWISFHPEAVLHVDRMLSFIKSHNVKAGVVLNPATAPQFLRYLWDKLDYILVMTVNPGFGGQKMIDACLQKVSDIKAMAIEAKNNIIIEVDGGVDPSNVARCIQAGANCFVVGNAFFGQKDKALALANLNKAIEDL